MYFMYLCICLFALTSTLHSRRKRVLRYLFGKHMLLPLAMCEALALNKGHTTSEEKNCRGNIYMK